VVADKNIRIESKKLICRFAGKARIRWGFRSWLTGGYFRSIPRGVFGTTVRDRPVRAQPVPFGLFRAESKFLRRITSDCVRGDTFRRIGSDRRRSDPNRPDSKNCVELSRRVQFRG